MMFSNAIFKQVFLQVLILSGSVFGLTKTEETIIQLCSDSEEKKLKPLVPNFIINVNFDIKAEFEKQSSDDLGKGAFGSVKKINIPLFSLILNLNLIFNFPISFTNPRSSFQLPTRNNSHRIPPKRQFIGRIFTRQSKFQLTNRSQI